jgi:hypothetical protein
MHSIVDQYSLFKMPKIAVGIYKMFNNFSPQSTSKKLNKISKQCIKLINNSNSSILKYFRVFLLCQTLCKRKETILPNPKKLDGKKYLRAQCLLKEISIRREARFKIYQN